MVDELNGEKSPSKFDEGSPEGQALREWWCQLHGYEGTPDGVRLAQLRYAGLQPGWPGVRAELRRAQNVLETVFCRGYQQLRAALPNTCRDESRLTAVVRVLAHVKELPPAERLWTSLATRMGSGKSEGDDTPLVSELRFKRLLRTDDRQEFADLLIRFLPIVDNTANPLTLAGDIWFWNEATRKRWANDYYQALLG